jgi:hypothetical protein
MQYIITYATMYLDRNFSVVTRLFSTDFYVSSWRQIAREGPVEGVSCGAHEFLQEAKKEVDGRG